MSTNIHLLRRTENGGYRLETFRRRDAPSYAILSHTWSKDQSDEVTFQDIRRGSAHFRKAFPKLTFCDQQARRDRLDYFWIDTCCIDKGNEVEEKSTVSLMWQIYEAAEKCYALLSDVLSGSAQSDESSAGWEEAMKTSRWFARGWTLQELLAPRVVEFYSHEGDKLGDKSTLKELIHGITGISIGALEGQEMSNFGIEERLRWARDRETTREEDQSYSLFGLFGISMEISYGEGKEIARARLLAEVEDRCVVRNDAGRKSTRQTRLWICPLAERAFRISRPQSAAAANTRPRPASRVALRSRLCHVAGRHDCQAARRHWAQFHKFARVRALEKW